jgi:hypothetical protein
MISRIDALRDPGVNGHDLRRGEACSCPGTAGTCRELRASETHLWSLVRVGGSEPTSNDAEPAPRDGVTSRKNGGRTDCESGSRFVERILPVVATRRQREINALDDLTGCYRAHLEKGLIPRLLPTSPTAQVA